MMKALLTTLLCSLMALPVQAEDEQRHYDVEVVIFANRNVPSGENIWERQMLVPDLSGTLSLDAGTAPVDPASTSASTVRRDDFFLLDPAVRQLTAEAETLRRSSRYELLLHTAWRQPGLPRESRIGVQMRAGTAIQAFVEVPSDADTALPMNGDDAVLQATDRRPLYADADYVETETATLNGSIAIGLGRYLHAHTDLIYSEPAPSAGAVQPAAPAVQEAREAQETPASAIETLDAQQSPTDALFNVYLPAWQSYRVQDHRRMRSRELHHLDHPKLGVLILITPYEPEDEDADNG